MRSVLYCQPPCEAVSWNKKEQSDKNRYHCQPPCEAVSWNRKCFCKECSNSVSLLVRLWVEIGYSGMTSKETMVSLLVRLWVEMEWDMECAQNGRRQPPCEAVSWNEAVMSDDMDTIASASLWGCELKFSFTFYFVSLFRQPPCEAVSWNTGCEHLYMGNNQSASLWGCELKLKEQGALEFKKQSASLWGCELKYGYVTSCLLEKWRQPPCEAVSWNVTALAIKLLIIVSLLVRLWVEIATYMIG